jgi:predicted TIM-barrel fold metal-dependent hydrolase
MGIHTAIIYPNAVGFSSNHIFAIEDRAQRGEVLRLFNDFYVDLQQESGERLLPQAMLPVWDMDFTVKEMERLLDAGTRGFILSDKPQLMDLPELDDEYYAPMWSLANDSGAVINFHIGSGASRVIKEDTEGLKEKLARPADTGKTESFWGTLYWDSFGPQRRLAVLATLSYMSNARIIVNLCMGDLFDRYPNLKIASAESGIGWVPFILEAMEYQLDEMVTDPGERALQRRRPTDYFRDHIYVMFWFENLGPQKMLEDIGVNTVLVETDVPHPTCVYPGARERFAKSLGHLDRSVVQRVLQDNAAELYKIDMSK